MMLAVLTSFGDWANTTKPLLEFMQAFPDSISIVVVDDSSDVRAPRFGAVTVPQHFNLVFPQARIAEQAPGMGIPVIQGRTKPLDRVEAINVAWAHFQRSPAQFDTLMIMQNDVKVSYGVFDRMARCVADKNITSPSTVVPLINSVLVGEKNAEADTDLLTYQCPTGAQAVVESLSGRLPRDCHQRLPCTYGVHACTTAALALCAGLVQLPTAHVCLDACHASF